MFNVQMIPFVPGDSNNDTIQFIATGRDAATLIHAYMTCCESVMNLSVYVVDDLWQTDDMRLEQFNRNELASPASDSMAEKFNRLFLGDC